MNRKRLSAIVFSVLLVVSAATAVVPASALVSTADSTIDGGVAGNDSTATPTETTTADSTTTDTTTTDTTTTDTTATATTATTRDTTTATDSKSKATASRSDGKADPKVASSLLDRIEPSGPTPDGTKSADFVQVVVRASPGRSDEAAGLVGANSGDVQARHDRLVQARLPAAAVHALASSPAVEFVREPHRPETNEITSEGLSNMDVGNVHDAGYTGAGVTVAVVDSGFDVTNPEIADQVVDFRNFSSPGSPRTMSNESGEHGTATAELVADTAPNASIIAVKVGTEVELYEAIDWLESETDADVVTMSMSWYNVGPLDGTAYMNREINDSIRNGTTWLTSAGNDGYQDHWNGTWENTDNDSYMNFPDGENRMNVTPAGGTGWVLADVSWNDWPASHEDYDAYLVNETGQRLDVSYNAQNGTQDPTERVYTYASNENVYLKIKNFSANGTADFDVFFRRSGDPEFSTRARSVTIPATGRNIIAVGAADYSDNTLEYFSSRGPTIDGRIKPDVVAPDGVTTSGYSGGFFGTSASTPHTAGVVALMLDADGSLTPAKVKSRLQSSAVPLRGTEPNNRTGYGLVDADGAIHAVEETSSDRVTYSGTVEEADGTVANDDEIIGYRLDSTGTIRGRTDGTGAYSMSTVSAEGKYAIGYYQGDWSSPDSTYLPLDGSPDLYNLDIVNGRNSSDLGTVTLPQAHVLNVTVVDESGDPVPYADVEVMHFRIENGTWSHADFSSETRGDGTFTVGGTAGIEVVGDVRVRAGPPDGSTRFEGSTYTDLINVQNDTNVTVALRENINVSGQVNDADGNPSANDLIYLTNATADAYPWDYTNASGEFTVSDVQADRPYNVGYFQDVGKETRYPHDGTPDVYALDRVATNSDIQLGTYDLPNASLLNVKVVNESGAPVENASVNLVHRNGDAIAKFIDVPTDAGGYMTPRATDRRGMEFTGNVTVTVRRPDGDERYVAQTYTQNLTLTSDTNVTVTLAENINVSGRVNNANGDASADDSLLFSSDMNGDTESVPTSATGDFSTSSVQRAVPYTVGYFQNRRAETVFPQDGTADVYVLDRVNATQDVDLGTLDVPSAPVLNVKVTNESGTPVENATVSLTHHRLNETTGVGGILTDSGGYIAPGEGRGIEMLGNVTVEVEPPEDATVFKNQTSVRNLNVTTDENVTVTLDEKDLSSPNISSFEVASVSNEEQKLTIDLYSNESLDTLEVKLTDNSGNTIETFTKNEMVEDNWSDFYEYGTTHVVESDGQYRATLVNATDEAGNGDPSGNTTDSTVVDTTPPTITLDSLTADGGNAVVSDGERVTMTATVTDELSTVESATADASAFGAGTVKLTSVGDGVYRGNFTVDASGLSDGSRILYVTATDAESNERTTAVHDLLLDTHAPNTSKSLSGTAGDADWYTSAVEVTLTASDGTSSVARTQYRLDGGDWQTYDGPVTVTEEGQHTVEYRSIDKAGNEESVASVTFKVDTTAPTTRLSTNVSANENGWYDSDVNVTLSADDGVSGVDATHYRLDGGNWRTYDGNVTLTDGNHTLEYYSVDAAGHEETWHTETIKIDTQEPRLTGPPGLNRTEGVLPEHAIRVVLNATDDRSGVAAVAVDGVPVGRDGVGDVPAAAALGNRNFEVVVTDAAGNEFVVSNESTAYSVGETVEMRRENDTFAAETNDTNIREIAIETNDSTSEANVTVGTSRENPELDRRDPEGTSLYFPQINTSVSNDDIENATVTVTVERSRVRQQYIEPNSVRFWVEQENEPTGWETVDARRVDESADGTYTYEIEAPHFSTYAITGEKESTPPTVTAFGPASDSPVSGDVTVTAEYGDDYSGVDPANVTLTLDGEDVTADATVAESGLTYTANLSAGDHNATISVVDNASNAHMEAVSFTVADDSDGGSGGASSEGGSSGGGSGGGGGSASIPPPPVQVSLSDVTTDGFTARIASARASEPGRIVLDDGIQGGDVTVRSVTVTPESADAQPRFFLDGRAADAPPDGASAPETAALGYLQLSPTYAASEEFAAVTVRFAVPASAADAPENVVTYRLDGGEWHRVETAVVGERGGQYVLEATASGVGTFAVGATDADGSATDTTAGTTETEPDETTAATTGEEDGDEESGDGEGDDSGDGGDGGIPGFGVGAALLALSVGLLAVRRRT